MSEESKPDSKQLLIHSKRPFPLTRSKNTPYSLTLNRTNQYQNPNIKSLEKQFGYIIKPQRSKLKIIKSDKLVNTSLTNTPLKKFTSSPHSYTKVLNQLKTKPNSNPASIHPSEGFKSSTSKQPYTRKRVKIVLPKQNCSQNVSFSVQETQVASHDKLSFTDVVGPMTLNSTKWREWDHIIDKCSCLSCVFGFQISPKELCEGSYTPKVVVAKNKYVKRLSMGKFPRECNSSIRFNRNRSSLLNSRANSHETQASREISPKNEEKTDLENYNSARDIHKFDKVLSQESFSDKRASKERYYKVKIHTPKADSNSVKSCMQDRYTAIRPNIIKLLIK